MSDTPPIGEGPADALPEVESRSQRRRSASRRPRSRVRRLVMTLGATVLVVVLGVVTWYELQSHALGPAGPQVVITVGDGESIGSVVSTLAHDKVIGSTLAFRLFDEVHGNPSVSPGTYALNENLTYPEIRAILQGDPNVFPITVRSGYALSEVAERVDALPGLGGQSFAKVAASGVVHSVFSPTGSENLEGLLGTGTYLVTPGETDAVLLSDMVQRFDAQATSAGVTAASASALGLTTYQLIIAASVVEKEGYIPKNMPDVARVIYNRLKAGTPLQMDSTILYALGQDGGPVTPADEQIQSPYNSYLNTGLPPTPICTPSVTALSAASHPPPGGWLYFELVSSDGTEAFADTFAQQLANENLAKSRGVG